MKNILIISSILLATVSCKKNADVPTAAAAPAKKISKIEYVEPNYSSTKTMLYDENGRLASFTFNNEIDVFEYSGSSLLVTRKNKSTGALKSTFEATVNSQGAITFMKMKLADGSIYELLSFTYDAQGYMVKMKSEYPLAGNTYSRDFFYTNGNLTSSKNWYNGTHAYNYETKYDLSKTNSFPEAAFYRWPSATLFGKTIRNVMIENKLIKASDNSLSSHFIFNGEYDASGLLVKLVEKDVLNNTTGTYNYSY